MKIRIIIILLLSVFLLCTRSNEPLQTQPNESPTLLARIEARIDPSALTVLLEGSEEGNLQPMSSSSEDNCVTDKKGKTCFTKPSVVTKKEGVLSFATSVKNLTTDSWTGVNLTLTSSDDDAVSPANPSNGEGEGNWFWALHDIPAGQETSPETLSLNVPDEKPFKLTLELHSGNPDIESIERDCEDETITINGKNLGSDPEKGNRATVSHNIKINGRVIQDDDVLSWEDTKITAVLGNGVTEGFVAVTKGGQPTCKKHVDECPPPPPPPPPPACPSLSQWSATSSMNVSRQMLASVSVNGWIYAIGGTGSYTSGPPVYSSVERAQINPDGSLGSWQYTTSLNQERCDLAAIASNGWIYALGGTYRVPTNGYWYIINSVERANINGDGSLDSWSYTSSMNELRYWPGVIVYNNWIYALGGYNASGGVPTNLASIERASINPDGSLNAWEPLAQTLPQGMHAFAAFVNNGWVYVIGGRNSNTSFSSVYRAAINADGTFGTWIIEPSLNISRDGFGAAIVNGKIYITGGITVTSPTVWDLVFPAESAVINPDGSLDPWCIETNLTSARNNDAGVGGNNRIYAIGGSNKSSVFNTVETAQTQ